MRFFLVLSLSLCASASLVRSKILVNYTGGEPASVLGVVELEGQDLGDRLSVLDAGDGAYIQPVFDDKTNMSALRFHRDSHYRRAEVRSLYGDVEANKTYYIGYTLRVPKMRDHLVIFQWKKQDKFAAPRQNIPFHLFFSGPDQLSLEYTTPGSNGSNRTTYWTGNFSTGHDALSIHTIGMAIDTHLDGRGSLELFLDGKPAVRLDGAQLFTGATYPKFGIYRAEADAEKDVDADEYAVDSFVYRVQVSDGAWADVAEAAGLSDDVLALLEATEPRSASKWSTTL